MVVWKSLCIAIYVDESLLAGLFMSEISLIIVKLSTHFDMINIGSFTCYPSISIWRKRLMQTLYLFQHSYIKRVLREFCIKKCKPMVKQIDFSIFEVSKENYCYSPTFLHYHLRVVRFFDVCHIINPCRYMCFLS